MEAVIIVIGSVALLCAIGTISFKDPVHCAVSLIGHMVSLAALFIALHAEFLAMVQVIVYAGAVVVLFIFIIAYLGTSEEVSKVRPAWEKNFVLFLALTMIFEIVWVINTSLGVGGGSEGVTTVVAGLEFGSTKLLAHELFSRFFIPFELASVLLLVAAVGVLALLKRVNTEKRENGETV